ncbi:winged helix-turn-helix domain-containing protein [Phenylobacterium sp.]|jgi:DNA-binding winged helix-turn-helix (wHTH) protein/TolB-like protein|uniref:winged helix-turn-helix domain-containing protein n=1 Tax=Phenylobacterium sp. TaxID=1871053 RepID=UPI002E325DB7|nr:winged helix-turn-helix domain-containing protein [Phenylobacterium sp.]HEX3365234.1 winged helix-turn-helix domain-containing protein [Phenylobacterium sp.]
MTNAPETTAGVDLAHEPDFSLGAMVVVPSACLVRSGEAAEHVEPRVMQVLILLARNAGRTVTRDQLIDACWGGRIVSDDAVNRVLAQVRALGRSLKPEPFTLETVPKVGFRLIAADAAARSPASGTAPPRDPSRRRRVLIAAGLALALLAIAGGLAWRFWPQSPSRPPGQNGRVDVMAFEAAPSDPELQKVAADIPETIVRALADGGFAVAERPAPRDAAESAAELRVAGAVQRENANYVINAQILDRKTGLVLWTYRFVRTARELQESPGDIANQIAAILACAIWDRRAARTPISTEAFGLYLNTCASTEGNGGAEHRLALTRRLVVAAPQFANAHALHAMAAAQVAWATEQSPAEAAALHAESKAAAEQALKLDPHTPRAYSGLVINVGGGGQLKKDRLLEEQYLLKGLALDHDFSSLRKGYAQLLRETGRNDAAIEFIRASDAARDTRGGQDSTFALLLAAKGDLGGAERAVKQVEASSRTSQRSMRQTIVFWWEDPKAALAKIRGLVPADGPQENAGCDVTYLQELDARKAKHVRGLPEICRGKTANWRVRALAREGDIDGAYAELRPTMPGGTLFLFYPEMKAFRRDPRFWPFAKSVGLTDYWLKSGHWPDFCAEPDLPYDCRKAAAAA